VVLRRSAGRAVSRGQLGCRRARGRLAAHRVARRREAADQIHLRYPAPEYDQEEARADRQGAISHRARLRGLQGGVGPRPLRGPPLPRLASPRLRRPLLLRLRRRGTRSALFPPDPTAKSTPRDRARGLNDISTIPSPPRASPSPVSSRAGSLVVRSAITVAHHHTRALPSSRS